MIELPVSWLIGVISVLGTTIATLATCLWSFVKSRLAAQDTMIQAQTTTIEKLQDDIDRLSKGCGMAACVWKHR